MCGTFDVHNYGDLLFPLIAQVELGDRLPGVTVVPYSYQEKALSDWPFAVSSLIDVTSGLQGSAALLVGGGHLIRFDKRIAIGYVPPVAGIHHPTGYWLAPQLVARHQGVPIAWNAPSGGDIPDWAHGLLRLALGGSDYVSVRDESTRSQLAAVEPGVAIAVVPDSAFGLDRIVSLEAVPSPAFRALRAELELTGPTLVVQARRNALTVLPRLLEAFPLHQVLAVPIGIDVGDDPSLFRGLPRVRILERWSDPRLLAEVLGRADALIGSSLHLGITALVFDVPLLRPADASTGKYGVLQRAGVWTCPPDGALPVGFVSAVGAPRRAAALTAEKERLRTHWDAVAEVVAGGGRAGRRENGDGGHWQQAAFFLEPSGSRPAKLNRSVARAFSRLARVRSVRMGRGAMKVLSDRRKR